MTLLTVLELVPPAGAVDVAVVGRAGELQASLDLLLLAPTTRQALRPAWRREAARLAAERVAADGVAYVLAAPPARRLVRRALARRGFTASQALLHLPDARATQRLVALDAGRPARAALGWSVGRTSRRRRLLCRALAMPGGARAATWALGNVGVALRRPGAPACFAWLVDDGGLAAGPVAAAVVLSWRGIGGGAVVAGWRVGAPAAVAKVTFGAARELDAEASALERLGPQASAAGARVPRIVGRRVVGRAHALIESFVSGRQGAELLREHPHRLEALLADVAGWLGRFHRATARLQPLDDAWLERWVHAPVAALGADLPAGYRDRLADLASSVRGRPAPLVVAHNDLTMANVVWSPGEPLGVLDWAAAGTDALPGMDFLYAAIDAIHTAASVSRAEAFAVGVERPGRWSALTRRLHRVAVADVPLTGEVAALAMHACFLRHAADEQRAQDEPGRPFLELMLRVAQTGVAREDL